MVFLERAGAGELPPPSRTLNPSSSHPVLLAMEAMENALATPPVAPTPAPIVAAAVLTRRRSHLDSASFRTLSRLFSHCLHLHLPPNEGSTPPEAEPAAAGPIGGDSVVSPEAPGVADFDRLNDVEGEASNAGDPSLHGIVSPAGTQVAAANPTGDPAEATQYSVEDADAAVIAETSDRVEESDVGARLAVAAVVEDEALKSVEACLETEVDGSVEEAMGDDEGQLLFDAMLTNFTGLIDDVADGEIAGQSCATSGGELQNSKVSEVLKHFGGGIEDGEPVNNSDCGQNAGGGFEEGEIEGEFQDWGSEESENSELGDEDADDEDLGTKGSGANESCDNGTGFKNLHSTPAIPGNGHLLLDQDANVSGNAQISAARAQAVSYDDVVFWNETPLPNNEAPNHPDKKKKRSTTEERKATKTKNKRMKRAQERIANGVIRPKLKPLIKQKPPCRYYKHGNCQHGDSCNFSHDFTPLTKSKPCKHFACGSCLKGDQCPYDHELSKYECHNYKNNGMCSRGDKCKFSHVMRTTEGTPAPDAKSPDASLAFEKRTLTEYTSSQKSSTVHNGGHATCASTKQQHSILKNLSGVSINAQNISNRIPKGVQFLPFSKGVPNMSYLHPSALSIEKQMNANGSQLQHPGKHETEKEKIVKQYSHLDVKNLSKEATIHPCSEPKKASLPNDSTGTPGSIPAEHEASESFKILEEFLLGVGS